MLPTAPDPRLIRTVVDRSFHPRAPGEPERVAEGVSTGGYQIRCDMETFYLRVLPEADASFAPEARVHQLLRDCGVRVPEVVHVEHCEPLLERSIMVTRDPRPPPGYSAAERQSGANSRQGRTTALAHQHGLR